MTNIAPINILAYKLVKQDGYGRYVLHTMRALHRLGVPFMPGTIDVLEQPAWVSRLAGWDFSRLTLSAMPAHEAKPVGGRQWLLTMWEDDSLPTQMPNTQNGNWADQMNRLASRVIVPCEHNKEVFERRGVRVPVDVVHGGTCPTEFPLIPYVQRETYTFLALGDRGARKGIETAYQAFFKAFPTERDVRLIIKMRDLKEPVYALKNSFASDDRISFWIDDIDHMGDVFAQADCVLYPAYGDGWGMFPREAAMSGLPVICTNWSGTAVGIEHWAYPLNKLQMKRSMLPSQNGYWAVPQLDEVVERMRYCYEHRAEARAFGEKARAWLVENQTWGHSAMQLKALLEKHG